MAREYALIALSIWNSKKFETLGDNQDAKFLYFYLHTCPSVMSSGCYVLRPRYALADLRWTEERFAAAMKALCYVDLTAYDHSEHVVRIINYLHHNPPTNPNHAKAIAKQIMALPDCVDKRLALKDLAFVCRKKGLIDIANGLDRVSQGYLNSTESHRDRTAESRPSISMSISRSPSTVVPSSRVESSPPLGGSLETSNSETPQTVEGPEPVAAATPSASKINQESKKVSKKEQLSAINPTLDLGESQQIGPPEPPEICKTGGNYAENIPGDRTPPLSGADPDDGKFRAIAKNSAERALLGQHQPEKPKPVITILTDTGREHPIWPHDLAQFTDAYPNIDVPAELRKMKAWAFSNPTQRKTARGMLRFVNAWLDRETRKIAELNGAREEGRTRAGRPSGHPVPPGGVGVDPERVARERMEWLALWATDGRWPRNLSGNGVWRDALGIGAPPDDERTMVTPADLAKVPRARARLDAIRQRTPEPPT